MTKQTHQPQGAVLILSAQAGNGICKRRSVQCHMSRPDPIGLIYRPRRDCVRYHGGTIDNAGWECL